VKLWLIPDRACKSTGRPVGLYCLWRRTIIKWDSVNVCVCVSMGCRQTWPQVRSSILNYLHSIFYILYSIFYRIEFCILGYVTQVTQSQSVMVILASNAESLSSRHAIPYNGSYSQQLSWAPTPKQPGPIPGFPVPVLVVSECALATPPHVPQSLMLDYTSWLPSPCIRHAMIAASHNI